MVFVRKIIDIGDRVEAVKDIDIIRGTFTKGHVFTVVGCNNRGFNLIDDEGNECNDVPPEFVKRIEPVTQESSLKGSVHREGE